MFHEIEPLKLDSAFRLISAEAEDFTLFFHEGSCLLPPGFEAGTITRLRDFPLSALEGETSLATEYLFSIDKESEGKEGGKGEKRFFLLLPENAAKAKKALLAAGWKAHPPGVFRKFPDSCLGFACVTARHISVWRENTKFCGRCGARTAHSSIERAAVCPACAFVAYPSIMPAVIVAVHDGERLLMVKPVRASYWLFTLIAGYTEIGETLEQTARREVAEETGLKIKNIRYFGNQPWGFSCTHMVAFSAELDGSPEFTLQKDEIKEALWVHRKDIPLPPDFASLGGEMIRRFKEGGAAGL